MNISELERVVKGFASSRRLKILMILEDSPDITLFDIAEKLNTDFRTAGEHTRKLAIASLIVKHHRGAAVEHAITSRGKAVLKFCRTLE